jgi:hypothetical protein
MIKIYKMKDGKNLEKVGRAAAAFAGISTQPTCR